MILFEYHGHLVKVITPTQCQHQENSMGFSQEVMNMISIIYCTFIFVVLWALGPPTHEAIPKPQLVKLRNLMHTNFHEIQDSY